MASVVFCSATCRRSLSLADLSTSDRCFISRRRSAGDFCSDASSFWSSSLHCAEHRSHAHSEPICLKQVFQSCSATNERLRLLIFARLFVPCGHACAKRVERPPFLRQLNYDGSAFVYLALFADNSSLRKIFGVLTPSSPVGLFLLSSVLDRLLGCKLSQSKSNARKKRLGLKSERNTATIIKEDAEIVLQEL